MIRVSNKTMYPHLNLPTHLGTSGPRPPSIVMRGPKPRSLPPRRVSSVTAQTSASSRSGERPPESPSRPKSAISSADRILANHRPPRSFCPRLLELNLEIHPHRIGGGEQPFQRKPGEVAAQHLRQIGLLDADPLGGGRLRQPAVQRRVVPAQAGTQ